MSDLSPPALNLQSPFADMKGHHVAVRTPDFQQALDFYVGALDFRVVAIWDYGDTTLAYVSPPADVAFHIEILGGGVPEPAEARPYTDLADSMRYRGYHHFCLSVDSVEVTLERLRERGVTIVTEPFVVDAIHRKLAFFSDPFGNLIELAEVLA